MADGEAERRPMGAPALQGWRRRLSPPHELGMDLARRDALALLRLSGRLEDTGVAAVEQLVEELLAGDVVSVVCDVSAVTHVGRDAARRLVQAASMRPAAPSPIVLCAVGGQAADVFASVDPAGRLPAFATLPQALAVQSARTQRAELTLSGDTQAPGRARAFGRAVCSIWALDAAVDDVLLVISELVTNAVLHAGAADRLTLQRWDAQLTVAVTDAARSLPAPCPAPPDTESGRGLQLVEHLSVAMGSYAGPRGKAVWCTLDAGAQPGGRAESLSGVSA